MVVASSPAGSFCIDATETTNAEYAQFLANPDVAPQPAYCTWNQSFEPKFPLSAGAELPVVGVDYCDARAYCEWAGKRLCGRIGGGATPFNSYADARESQWYAACSAGGALFYPYGNSYDPTACNGADLNRGGLVAVGSTRCEGGPKGVFDMSGNAWEWENSCEAETGVDDKCRLRGGEFTNPSGFLRCDYGEFYIERDFTSYSIGIRCCGP